MLDVVLQSYSLSSEKYTIQSFGTGLINNTWKIQSNDSSQDYILQRINHAIFKRPEDIAYNITCIGNYLQKCCPDYLFMVPLHTANGEELIGDTDKGYFRIFPFLKNSRSIDSVQTHQQAFEAARQFALFTKKLSGFPAEQLRITLPDFHNLTLRYQQFSKALKEGNSERIEESFDLIAFLQKHQTIVETYEAIKRNPEFKIRVTHHDTKISNVLFDEHDKGLCVIDLDTVMPGYFISDAGDMMRTYLSEANEEETDFSKIKIRKEIFSAIAEGYIGSLQNELTNSEKEHFVYAGQFMIYMQAIRFLTDYLNNDIYYSTKYEKNNLMRAKNQAVLLQQLIENETELNKIVMG
jgi:thiamine kinase-like enzyme